MSTSSTAPVTFNGSSTYASSFQQVITRAVGIASLPIQSLQATVTTLNGQASEVTTLQGLFTSLNADILSLNSLSSGSPATQSSNYNAVSATATTGALNGTYTLQVDDIGSSTRTLSSTGLTTVANPATQNISSAASFTLTINGTVTTITPSGTSLQALAKAINTANAGAQATIVNFGSNASPNYRLAVSSANLGADTVQLNDGTNDLLGTMSTGSPSLYKVNGSTTAIQGTSSHVTLSPGLTIQLLAPTTTPVTVTVSSDYSALQSALSSFVTHYNSAATELQKNVGQGGGALAGDSLVSTLSNALNQMATYAGSGSGQVSSLASLGVTLQITGQLAFDSTVFAGANQASISGFLGSVASSSGFLGTANNSLRAATDPTVGVLSIEGATIQTLLASKNQHIADAQLRVTALQNNLQLQLSKADAAIAALEQQNSFYQQLFTAQYGSKSNNG